MQLPLSKESLDELINIGFICDDICRNLDFHGWKSHPKYLLNYSRDNIVITFLQGYREFGIKPDSLRVSLHIKIFNHKGRNDIFRLRYVKGRFIVFFGEKRVHFYTETEKITKSYFLEKREEVLDVLSMLPLDVLKFFFGHYINIPHNIKSAMCQK